MLITHTSKLIEYKDSRLLHWCPGCEMLHTMAFNTPDIHGKMWEWDHDPQDPTIVPIYRNLSNCNYLIMKGKIHFDTTCTHFLSGQVVDMIDIPIKQKR